MSAVPAWPPRSLPRLFVDTPLELGAIVELDPRQSHYLAHVLRLGPESPFLLFDGSSGEWIARISETTRKRLTVVVEERSRAPENIPDVWLAFAPVKRANTDWLVEKATELGASRLLPVMTQRTVAERVKLERLRAIAVEAAEQCGRTRLPEIVDPVSLPQMLSGRDPTRRLYFADESGGGSARNSFESGPALILTGPEGGFTEEERTLVRSAPNAIPISLGPRILRAETAALAALAAYMAVAGDWASN